MIDWCVSKIHSLVLGYIRVIYCNVNKMFISWNNKTVFILFQKIEKKREEENCKSGFIIEERKKAIDRIKMHKIVIFLIIIILHPKQNPWNMVQEIQVLSWNMHKMWMVNPVNRIPILSLLFFGSPMAVQI
jgi:hypothetical protein